MKTYETDNATYLGTFSPNTPEWHELRAKGIGGSEIGTIVGLNPWESAYTLWHKKKGLIEDSVTQNWSIRFGNAFESPILQMFAEEHPELEIIETGTWQSNEHEWMHANPDALGWNAEKQEWVVIEIKTARSSWASLPPAYYAQVQWYMSVLGIKTAYVAAVAGWTWTEEFVEYDGFVASTYKAAAYRFWEYLQTDVKPDWDGSNSTYETVRALHPQISDESVELPAELYHLLYFSNEEYAVAQKEYNLAKSRVLDAMGKSKYATVDDVVVAQRQARGDGNPYLVVKGK